MAGIIYKSDFFSRDGVAWKVEIYDKDFSGSTKTFTTQGLNINYQSPNEDDLFSPILPSDVTVNALAEDLNFDAFVNNVFEAAENRFFIKIYKSSNLFWVGQMLADVGGMADEYYPQAVSFRAVDGLSYLKSINFNDNGSGGFTTDLSSYATFITLFFEVLNNLRTVTEGFWSATDDFLEYNVNWEDTAHSTGADVWANSRITRRAFMNYDTEGLAEYRTAYEVLELMLKHWNCRICLESGVWKISQIGEFDESTSTSYIYRKNATYNTTGEAINRVTDAKRLSTQSFSFLPALRSISQNFNHQSARNYMEGVTIGLNYSEQSLGTVTGGAGKYFMLECTFRISHFPQGGGSINPFIIKVDLQIQVGSKYLHRAANDYTDSLSYNTMSWSSSTNYLEYVTDVLLSSDSPGEVNFSIAIQTPDIPAGGGEVKVNVLNALVRENATGNNYSSLVGVDANLINHTLEHFTDNDPTNIEVFKIENGSNYQNFSEIHELDDAVFGDAVSDETPVKIQVYNGSSWVDSTDWSVDDLQDYDFTELSLVERMAVQRKNVLRREGIFKGAISINDVIQLTHHVGQSLTETRYFVAMRAALNCALDEWSGTWWNIRTDRSNVITSTTDMQAITLKDKYTFEPYREVGTIDPFPSLPG